MLFQVQFTSAMGDADAERLAHGLQMSLSMRPKLHDSPAPRGVLRLGPESALVLIAGDDRGRWVLEGRTWGDPPVPLVHRWHVLAAEAARRLDPSVPLPARPARPVAAPPRTTPVGRAANKPLGRFVRRRMGLE